MVYIFAKNLKREVLLPPVFFGPQINETVRSRIIAEVEGTTLGELGIVVAVMEVKDEDMGYGVIEYDTGCVTVLVKYSAIVYRPFEHEVVDALVTNCTPVGFFAQAGALTVFVHEDSMPDDMHFEASDPGAWVSNDQEIRIGKDCLVRLRIIGVRVEANQLSAVGTINSDFLGVVDDGEPEVEGAVGGAAAVTL